MTTTDGTKLRTGVCPSAVGVGPTGACSTCDGNDGTLPSSVSAVRQEDVFLDMPQTTRDAIRETEMMLSDYEHVKYTTEDELFDVLSI